MSEVRRLRIATSIPSPRVSTEIEAITTSVSEDNAKRSDPKAKMMALARATIRSFVDGRTCILSVRILSKRGSKIRKTITSRPEGRLETIRAPLLNALNHRSCSSELG
jgi:hypothetical protein